MCVGDGDSGSCLCRPPLAALPYFATRLAKVWSMKRTSTVRRQVGKCDYSPHLFDFVTPFSSSRSHSPSPFPLLSLSHSYLLPPSMYGGRRLEWVGAPFIPLRSAL